MGGGRQSGFVEGEGRREKRRRRRKEVEEREREREKQRGGDQRESMREQEK